MNLETSLGKIDKVSTNTEIDQPIVAERMMYYNYTGKIEDKDGKISCES